MKQLLQLIRPFREMRNLVALCLEFFLCAGGLWAQTTVSWSAADQGYENSEIIESVAFDANVTGAFYQGTNNNAPKYYTTGSAIRCYGGNYFTISTSAGNLTQIAITFASGEGSNAIITDVGTYSNGTWSGEAQSVTFTIGGTTGHRRLASFEITYVPSASSVAMPTFSPASGATFGDEGLSVTISQANNKPVYYTIDGTEPTSNSTLYTGAITLTSTTTIKAIAYDGSNASNVATATYTYVDPNAPGTLNNPYTVAQARAAIDAGTGTQGVYATGIVSAIPTAYSTQYSNITFNMVDEEGDEVFLQAYRCGGDEAANIAVGDIAVVYGNLTTYGSTYEFGQGCQLVSLTHPSVAVEAPTFSPAAGIYDMTQTVALSCATEGATIYYTTDGTEPTNASTEYITTITVSSTTTIKAIAYLDENASTVATATYTIVSLGNISDITEVGTAYEVQGTVVATNNKGFVMGDGTGYVYVYLNAPPTVNINEKVTVFGITGTYGQIIQFTNTATVSAATSSNYNGTPVATLITEVPDYSQSYHLSTYLEYEGELTKKSSNYLIAVGEDTIQISYPTSAQETTLSALDGRTVHVKGYFSGINSSGKFTTMLEEVASTEPVITVDPAMVEATAEGMEGTLMVTYENIPNLISFDMYFCDANGGELEVDPEWVSAEIIVPTADEGYTVSFTVNPNDGEARTAYFKVYTSVDGEEVYSNLVTIMQAEYVAPALDYATLPFEFDGGKADIESTDGLTEEGLGGDYNNSPKLRFDGTGDWLVLHFNEEPGTLTFDIKGNGFNGSTFTVLTSENGEDYTALATYTELGATNTEEFPALGTGVRYIKWIYTEKVQNGGNVALGNITLAKPTYEPVITLAPASVEVGTDGAEGILTMTYLNMGEEPDFEVQFVDEEGESATYDWIIASVNAANNNVAYTVSVNEGEARVAYLKVLGITDNADEVPSNIVTISQAAYVAPATGDEYALFTGDLVEGDYVIYYGGYAMKDVVENDRLSYVNLNPDNDVVITSDASIVWHIAPSGDYWTVYSADVNAFAAGTSVKNKAQMLEDGTNDMALWTVTEDENGYEFVNKANAAAGVNANLRNNGTYGFACYSTSTGGALSLYKKVTSIIECDPIVLTDEAPTKSWDFDELTESEPQNGYTGEGLGDCWTWTRTVEIPGGIADTLPHLYYNSAFAHSGDYSLRLWNRGVLAMPMLDETVDIQRVKMSFYNRHSFSLYTMMVGVMNDPEDPNTFVPVAYVDNGSSTGVEYFEFDFSSYDGTGRYIAFKNVRRAAGELDANVSDYHSVNYIDDITLTLMPATTCTIELADLPYTENFDAITSSHNAKTGASPRCWEVVKEDATMTLTTEPQVYYGNAQSGSYSLLMLNRGVYAMPALSEDIDINKVQLSMYVSQPSAMYYRLEVGVWDEATNTFDAVALVNNSTTGMEQITCDFANYKGNGRRIAFRNILGSNKTWDYSYNYIDNVVLSLQGACQEITETYTESFEDVTDVEIAATHMAPSCWEVVEEDVDMTSYPQVYYNSSFANTGSYSLQMTDRCVYAMPALADGVNLGDLSITLYVYQPTMYYELEVGVWDGTEFTALETVKNASEMTEVTVDFNGQSNGRIAFRNTLNRGKTWNYSYNYIDDISFGPSTGAKNEAVEGGVNDAMNADRYLESIVVYPNPTTGVLHIDAMDVQKVECYNQMGQLVGVYDNADLDLGSLAEGVYTLRITVPQGVTMRKVVKK